MPYARVAVAIAGLAMLAGCGATHDVVKAGPSPGAEASCGPDGRGFSLSIAAGVTGAASPEAAATSFAIHDGAAIDDPAHSKGIRLARTGWHVTAHDESGATVRSGGWQLHAIQLGRSKTWLIDGGHSCP